MKAPGSAVGESEPPPGSADTNEPDPCVCGALMAESLLPMLRRASEAFAEVRQVIPTLAELNRRLAVLERGSVVALDPPRLSPDDGHAHSYSSISGFRCSWCGAKR